MWPGLGKGCSLLPSLSWEVFSWEMQRYHMNWLGGSGAGLSSLTFSLEITVETAGVLVLDCCCPGDSLLLRWFLSFTASPFCGWASAHKSSCLNGTFSTSSLTGKGTSPEGVSPRCLWKPGCHCPALLSSAGALGFFAAFQLHKWCPTPTAPVTALELLLHLYYHAGCAHLCCSSLLL